MEIDYLNKEELLELKNTIRAACDGPFFPDWEFSTLLGIKRDELREYYKNWDSLTFSNDVLRTLIAVITMLDMYPHRKRNEIFKYTNLSIPELNDLLEKILNAEDQNPQINESDIHIDSGSKMMLKILKRIDACELTEEMSEEEYNEIVPESDSVTERAHTVIKNMTEKPEHIILYKEYFLIIGEKTEIRINFWDIDGIRTREENNKTICEIYFRDSTQTEIEFSHSGTTRENIERIINFIDSNSFGPKYRSLKAWRKFGLT